VENILNGHHRTHNTLHQTAPMVVVLKQEKN
jgi:hypothetical protein